MVRRCWLARLDRILADREFSLALGAARAPRRAACAAAQGRRLRIPEEEPFTPRDQLQLQGTELQAAMPQCARARPSSFAARAPTLAPHGEDAYVYDGSGGA
eukprot:tig00021036_g17334.t1